MSDKSKENKGTDSSSADKILRFEKPLVMAIVNLTPDSFYDGGRYGKIEDILNDVSEKIEQGADLIDLGAASSRPGATEISPGEEWKRLAEPLSAIREHFPELRISIDTCHSEIAGMAAELGADLINDISGGEADPNMFATVAQLQLPYIMMHMQGQPQTMQQNPNYTDVVLEIKSAFIQRIEILKKLGVNQIILDPGFGFGKSLTDNFKLLKHLNVFIDLNYPLLAGISRKSMVNKVLNTNPVTALNGSTVLHTIALLNGASMLRVHDVKEAKQAIELVKFYQNA